LRGGSAIRIVTYRRNGKKDDFFFPPVERAIFEDGELVPESPFSPDRVTHTDLSAIP
jgi:hypothetical protein